MESIEQELHAMIKDFHINRIPPIPSYNSSILDLVAVYIMIHDPLCVAQAPGYRDRVKKQADAILESQFEQYPRMPLVLAAADWNGLAQQGDAFASAVMRLARDQEEIQDLMAAEFWDGIVDSRASSVTLC